MNYLLEIRAFYDWLETNKLPTAAIALWHALMYMANKTQRQDTFAVAVSMLEIRTGLKRQAIYDARNQLKNSGRISFEARGGNQSAVYHIIPFVSDIRTQSHTQEHTQCHTQEHTQCHTHQPTINKQNKKQNKTGYISKADALDSPAAVYLPLNDGSQYSVTEAQVSEWSALYPAVDVRQQLRSMRGWLDANPGKRKTQRGIMRFINGWLSREQDRGYKNPPAEPEPPKAQPVYIPKPEDDTPVVFTEGMDWRDLLG